MNRLYFCCDERRRNAVRAHGTLNGIDFLEVDDEPNQPADQRQRTLRVHFLNGINDLIRAEALHPGWLQKLLTTPVQGLERHAEMLHHLTEDPNAIKVYVQVG